MVSKENQIRFYAEELKELEFSIKKTFNAQGRSLFQNGDLYIAQFRGFDEKRGNVFIDIPAGSQYHTPRLELKLLCFTLYQGLERPSKWGELTYYELLKNGKHTDAKVVDYIPSSRDGWSTMLVREMDVEFVENLKYNQILGFGPTIPPYEYLQNLMEFSKMPKVDGIELWEKLLNFQFEFKAIDPELLTEDIDIAQKIIQETDKSGVYIFQGPPGTGKTYQVADIAARLVKKEHSVLITSLTNKAAIEVCEKPFFSSLLEEDKVSKLPISFDEKKQFPKLIGAKNLLPIKGHVVLTTYYQFSRIWEEQTNSYDYVIIEEASQAFLTTIAAACKVGKKVIVVGDPKQIVPIVTNKNYKSFLNIEMLINGMNTVSQMDNFSFGRKTETRRLTKRAADFTNSFYDNTILSKSLYENLDDDKVKLNALREVVHTEGGPTLIQFSKENGDVLSQMILFVIRGINELADLKKNKIAVLTPFIETLTQLQQNLKSKTRIKNYLIESVDRVQGLDVDYCFYLVPKTASFSFNLNRFNVATSRAKKATFILVNEDFSKVVNLHHEVYNFLKKLRDDYSFTVTNEK